MSVTSRTSPLASNPPTALLTLAADERGQRRRERAGLRRGFASGGEALGEQVREVVLDEVA